MSTEETAATLPAPSGGSSLVKTAGLGLGLFVMMLAAQLVGPIIACTVLPGVVPGCQAVATATEGQPATPRSTKPPQYLPLDPPLVISFQDRDQIRFLQVTIELMARDDKVIAAVQAHSPVIRNNLLMLMGAPTVAELVSRDGKEQLRLAALEEVQQILVAQTGAPGVEDLYFTSFVVQ